MIHSVMNLTNWTVLAVWLLVLCSINGGQTIASVVTDHDRVVVCYIASWTVYKSYSWEHFDPKLCTHAIYAFAGLDTQTHSIKSLDTYLDLSRSNGGYEKLIGMRSSNPHLKVLLAVGGSNEASGKYSNMAANETHRKAFVKSALDFVKRYGFDGLDLDWEYPTQNGGKPYDRENFVSLVKELSQQFKKHHLLLTSVIGGAKHKIDASYDIENLSKYLDFMHITPFEYEIEPNTNMQSRKALNVELTIDHLLALGAPSGKIVMGLPFHGKSSVTKTQRTGISWPSTSVPIDYKDICRALKEEPSGWTVSWDAEASKAIATLTDGDKTKVMIYDSTRSMANKVRYAIRHNLGGLMIWSADKDDYQGLCDSEQDTFTDYCNKGEIQRDIPLSVHENYKLLRTINDAIVVAIDDYKETPGIGEPGECIILRISHRASVK